MSIQAEIEVLTIYYAIKLRLERKKASSILLIYYIIPRTLVKKWQVRLFTPVSRVEIKRGIAPNLVERLIEDGT